MSKEFLTINELVDRWGGIVAPQTLAGWRSKKYGPKYTKIGKQILYKITDIEKWEKDNKSQ